MSHRLGTLPLYIVLSHQETISPTSSSMLILTRSFGSRPLSIPRDGSSEILAADGTRSYQATAPIDSSHSRMLCMMRPSKPSPLFPEMIRPSTASLSKNRTTRSLDLIAAGCKRTEHPAYTARASSSKMMVSFPRGLSRVTWSESTRSEKNDSILPCWSKRTPPSPPAPFSKQASVYRWYTLPTADSTTLGPPLRTLSLTKLQAATKVIVYLSVTDRMFPPAQILHV